MLMKQEQTDIYTGNMHIYAREKKYMGNQWT